MACFWGEGHNAGGGDISINIDWKTGIAAKDWDSVARKEKIEVRTLSIPGLLLYCYILLETQMSTFYGIKHVFNQTISICIPFLLFYLCI